MSIVIAYSYISIFNSLICEIQNKYLTFYYVSINYE